MCAVWDVLFDRPGHLVQHPPRPPTALRLRRDHPARYLFDVDARCQHGAHERAGRRAGECTAISTEAGQHLPASLATQLWGTSDDPAPPPQSLFGDSLWGSQAAPPPAPPPASDANGSSGSIGSARFDSLWATSLRSESSGASGASGASGGMFASTADSLWSMPTARGEQAAFQPLPARKAEGTASMFSGDQWPTSTSGGRRGSDPTNNADDDDADPVKRSYSFF